MNKINETYLDSFAIPFKLFNDNINAGYFISVGLEYNFGLWGISVDYNRFTSQIEGSPEYLTLDFVGGMPVVRKFYGKSFIIIRSDLISVGASIAIHEILNLPAKQKAFLKNSRIFLKSSLGFGWAQNRMDFYTPNDTAYAILVSNFSMAWKAIGYSVAPSLQLEYPLSSGKVRAFLGITGGYRLYKTADLKDTYGNKWEVDETNMNLDFSGLYFAPYIRLGISN